MKKLISFLAICLVAFSSCKKDKKTEECSISEANIVGTYKLISATYKASVSSAEVDYLDQFLEPCAKDDNLILNSDHTYAYTDVGTICDPDGSYTGDWSLSGSTITVDGDTAPLDNFSCTGFSIAATDVNTTGDKLTLTYAKQ